MDSGINFESQHARMAAPGVWKPYEPLQRCPWGSKLRVLFANVMGAQGSNRHKEFIRDASTMDKAEKCHVICVQDVSKEAPFLPTGNFNVAFGSNVRITEQHHPNYEPKEDRKSFELSRVAFYIHKDIPSESWDVEFHDENPNAATLTIITDCGPLHIHNAYGHHEDGVWKLDMASLASYFSKHDNNLFGGDLNALHRHWDPAHGVPNSDARVKAGVEVYNATRNAGLDLLNTVGKHTYYKGLRPCSVLDLMFADPYVARRSKWRIAEEFTKFLTDHRITEVKLNMRPNRDVSPSFFCKPKDDEHAAKIVAHMNELFPPTPEAPLPPIDSEEALEELGKRIMKGSEKTITAFLSRPRRYLSPLPSYNDVPGIKHCHDQARIAKNLSEDPAVSREEQDTFYAQYLDWNNKAAGFQKTEKKKGWFNFISDGTKGNPHPYAKLAGRMMQPKESPKVPSIKHEGKIHVTAEQKTRAISSKWWKDRSSIDSKSTTVDDVLKTMHPSEVPQSITTARANGQLQLEKLQQVTVEEVRKLIDGLPSRRAPGHDLVTNAFLKLNRDNLVPWLVHFFNGCLRLCCLPTDCKFAKTVAVPKPKGSLSDPGNWRPIALLSSISKLLERVIVNRITKLNKRKRWIPFMQFGAEGQCTTKALQSLTNQVWHGWSLPRKHRKRSSILCFDIEGAYNDVDRATLLRILIRKGLPLWIIKWIASFLSNRSTTLELPGHKTEPKFFVNIGVPQGSPLSPILFLLFVSPILEEFIGEHDLGTKVTVGSYVDDMYLLVTSESYENNCLLIDEYFSRIKAWAVRLGITFKPSKFEFMHFKQGRTKRDRGIRCLPKIDDVSKREDVLRILGLQIEMGLNREAHVMGVGSAIHYNRLY